MDDFIYSYKSNGVKYLQLKSEAPTRIDLAGGTLDIAPLAPILQEKWGLWQQPVVTLNATINLLASTAVTLEWPSNNHSSDMIFEFSDRANHQQLTCTDLNNPDTEKFLLARAALRYFYAEIIKSGANKIIIETNAQAPRGSGLGGSSSLIICLLKAVSHILGIALSNSLLCQIAQNLEAGILGNLAGNQDHIAAAGGGVQCVTHSAAGSFGKRMEIDGNKLIKHIVLAYSKQPHFSAYSNWTILRQALEGHAPLLQKLRDIAAIAADLTHEIGRGLDWQQIGRLMQSEWNIRRTLADGITTPVLDAMAEAAIRAGATGTKVCGAGGGGVLMAVVPHEDLKQKICEKITEAGGDIIVAQYHDLGVRVWS